MFAECVRTIAVLYDGLVVPGALLLLGSGTWLIITVYGDWESLGMPWLTGSPQAFDFALNFRLPSATSTTPTTT